VLAKAGVADLQLRTDYDDDEHGRRHIADTLYSIARNPRIRVTLFRTRRWAATGEGWITVSSGDVPQSSIRSALEGEADIDNVEDRATMRRLQKAADICLRRQR
jgi:hypothetical protein